MNREIRPVSTGTWVLPPLPHPEPNFTKLARGKSRLRVTNKGDEYG